MSEPNDDELWTVVAGSHQGVLATVGATGLPHLSNVYYLADLVERVIRISTTTTRAKGRNLRQDPRCAMHVAGKDFFNFAVAEGTATLAVAETPGDAATDELYTIQSFFNGEKDRADFDQEVIDDHRVAVRVHVARLYGLIYSAAT